MIDYLRSPRFLQKVVIAFVLAITIPSFVLFYGFSGADGQRDPRTGTMMTVTTDRGETNIESRDLQFAQQQLEYEYMMAAFRMNPQGFQEARQAIRGALGPREVGNYAATQAILQERLEAQGIRVTDNQVREALKADGMTNQKLEAELKASGKSSWEYLQEVKERLRLSQAEGTVNRLARASLLELWQEHLLANEKMTVSWAEIPVTIDESVPVNDAEVKAEYDKLVKDKFSLVTDPERRVYRYLMMSAPARQQVAPTDEQLKAAYDEAPADDPQLQQEADASVTQVLAPISPTATVEQRDAARAAAEEARKKIQDGAGFEAVAGGGYLETMETQDFTSYTSGTAVFAGSVTHADKSKSLPRWGAGWVDFVGTAEPGTVSPVLETPQGFAVARLERRGEARRKTFEEARTLMVARASGKLAEEAERVRQEEIAKILEQVRDAARMESALEGVAARLSVDVKMTSPTISNAFFIVGIGSMSRERETLKDLRKGDLTPVLQTDRGDVVMLEVAEILPESPKDMASVREALEQRVRRNRAVEKTKADAEALRASIGASDFVTSKAMTLGYTTTTLEPFGRQEPPAQLYSVLELRQLLAANEGDIISSGVGSEDNITSWYVLQVTDVTEPSREEFLKNLQTLEGGLLMAKREAFVREFRADALRNAKVDFKSEYFAEREEKKPRRRDS